MGRRYRGKATFYALIERPAGDQFFQLVQVGSATEAYTFTHTPLTAGEKRLILRLPKDGDLGRLAESRLAKFNAEIVKALLKGEK